MEHEAEFLKSILFDDQHAAAVSWSRVQAVVLLLRYSLAAKLVYFGQTIDPTIVQPYAQRFDEIVLRTFQKVCDLEHLSEDQILQIKLAVREGGFGMRSHDLKELLRLRVATALLVSPAVLAATGESIGSSAPLGIEGGTYESLLSSSIQELVERAKAAF